ncbi:hypothetical protein ABZS66_19035 [Dactylosporangium sp. NPDC005572]|uniref:hypothetical protein n=1 Tax=Dactylosporangium sp. NPDC005572 TaxID=3156889 RepID=UPI0033BCD540
MSSRGKGKKPRVSTRKRDIPIGYIQADPAGNRTARRMAAKEAKARAKGRATGHATGGAPVRDPWGGGW